MVRVNQTAFDLVSFQAWRALKERVGARGGRSGDVPRSPRGLSQIYICSGVVRPLVVGRSTVLRLGFDSAVIIDRRACALWGRDLGISSRTCPPDAGCVAGSNAARYIRLVGRDQRGAQAVFSIAGASYVQQGRVSTVRLASSYVLESARLASERFLYDADSWCCISVLVLRQKPRSTDCRSVRAIDKSSGPSLALWPWQQAFVPPSTLSAFPPLYAALPP